jgi:DNA ligase-associated metallophosphoesterase
VQASERFSLYEQTLWLSTERCIYWEELATLIVSDLHFGKTGHFRKSGIAVPQSVYKEDMQRLVTLLQFYKPDQLLIVGDLFHSTMNKEVEFFRKWRNDFSNLHIQLVKGNHDILKKDWYRDANISVADQHFLLGNFCFIHDIAEACPDSPNVTYYFSGHIHPCISLKGLAKQSISLPCYYFSKNFAVIPAFSRFTGTALVDRKAADNVFAIIPANHSKGQQASVVRV